MVVPASLGAVTDGSVLRRCGSRPIQVLPASHHGTPVLRGRRRAPARPGCLRSGLAWPALRLRPPAGGEPGGRHPRVGCRGFWEPIVLGAAAAAFLGRPKSAPGPSETLIEREARARREVLAARERLEQASPEEAAAARTELDAAVQVLSKVEEELRASQLDMENYPVPEYLQLAYSSMKVMVAVTGASGVGKSSFINALRRLKPRDAGAAKTGVTETTMQPEMFSFPQRQGIFRRTFSRVLETGRGVGRSLLSRGAPQEESFKVGDRVLTRGLGSKVGNQVAEIVAVRGPSSWDVRLGDGRVVKVDRDQLTGVLAECVIWDLPGVGTPSYPQVSYLKEMGVRYFDVVVLMTATRFTEAELMLVEELRRWRVPFFLVRNKADADVQAEIEAEEDTEDEELSEERQREVASETIQVIKDYFRKEFSLDQVYCISSRRKLANQYDFQQLEKDLAEAVKRQRSVDAEKECPVCLEVYTECKGRPKHRKRRRPCGHTCCEVCLRLYDQCTLCDA